MLVIIGVVDLEIERLMEGDKMIDITKCLCARCFKAKVSEKDKSGIFLSYQGKEIPLCNECAIELANLILDAVRENGQEEIR